MKWLRFEYNFSSDFIDKVWADDTNLVRHLKSKFQARYNSYGSHGVMLAFCSELDKGNLQKLITWVLANY